VLTIPVGQKLLHRTFIIGWRPININSPHIENEQIRFEYLFMGFDLNDKLSIDKRKMVDFGKRRKQIAIKVKLKQIGIKREVT